MSTDLHLHHDLPKLRISSSIKNMENDNDTIIFPSSSSHNNTSKTNNVNDKNIGNNTPSSVVSRAEKNDDDDEESYRTPTSKESRIPAVLTCPPAPKKGKAFVSCKRKLLDEFQFFEVTNKEDMDAFFRSTFPKRTCPCT